ncbi:MAG TPA: hypothetical protein VND15_01225 [Candidatus Acidoferrales bacterium]|nr:hypothetical protein [Candidatus Acidoferrales bacterium]
MTDTKTQTKSVDQQIDELVRDGRWKTFNKAVEILRNNTLTLGELLRTRSKMECTVCNKVSCDHERPE